MGRAGGEPMLRGGSQFNWHHTAHCESKSVSCHHWTLYGGRWAVGVGDDCTNWAPVGFSCERFSLLVAGKAKYVTGFGTWLCLLLLLPLLFGFVGVAAAKVNNLTRESQKSSAPIAPQ